MSTTAINLGPVAIDWTDFFAGAGGWTAGLIKAGHRVRYALNHWPTAIASHAANHPDTRHYTVNLAEFDFTALRPTRGLVASPSCVNHAKARGTGKLSIDDELQRKDFGAVDRATAFAIIEAAQTHHYEIIVIENVVEFMAWVLYPWWLDGLRRLGYEIEEHIIDAVKVGTPQRRPRVIITARKDKPLRLVLPEMGLVPASTILDADPGKPVTRRLYVADQIAQIDDEHRHLVTYRKHAKARRADLHPLATITAGGNHHGVAQIIEGRPHFRMLTNRECARGQGFSDDYQWHGTAAEVKKQIGNAVAVPVAEFVGRRVAEALGVAA